MRKRFWALFLAVMMIVSVLPTTALAAPGDTQVSISGQNRVAIGNTLQLSTERANAGQAPTYTWSVSDETKATIVGNGSESTLTGVAAGQVTVTVTMRGNRYGQPYTVSDAHTVTVYDPNAPVKVYVYVMDDGWEGNTDFEGQVGLYNKDPNGFYPVGAVMLPAAAFSGSNPYLNSVEEWEVIKAAVAETLDTSGNSYNRNNNMVSYLNNVDTSRFGGIGSGLTALFNWNNTTSYGFADQSVRYHLDLRLESCQLTFRLVNDDIAGYDAGDVLGTRGYFKNTNVKEPDASDDWYLKLPTGYAVLEYYEDSACTKEYIFGQSITENDDVWVKVVPLTFTVKYNLAGGTSTTPNGKNENDDNYTYSNLNYGTATPEIAAPEKDGFTFTGWEPSVKNWVTQDVEYVAQWQAKEYKLTYVTNGGTLSNGGYTAAGQVAYGTQLDLPDADDNEVTKSGYTFEGWFQDTKFVTGAPATMPAANLTLYAKWTANTANYTVKHWFEKLDTTGEAKYEQLEAYPDETKSGNIGEETEAEAKTVAGFTAQAFKQDEITAGGSTVVNIYYNRNSYTVTYKVDNEQYGEVETYKYGAAVTEQAEPTKAGYTFSGWDPKVPATMPAEDLVIEGSFEANDNTGYKVEHYKQNLDGTGYELAETENLTGTTGATATATAKTYEGFTFDETVTGTVKSGTIAGNGGLVLKLYYTRNSYTVTYGYESNVPGQSDLPAKASYKYGASVTVAGAATAPGYTFSGWSKTGTFTMPAENVTITGSFTANTYDIIYMVDGVEYERVEDVAYGTTITLIDEPSNTGYTFSGWSTTDVTVTDGKFGMPAKNVTITGSWIKLVTVTFNANGGAWGGPVNGYTMSGEPYNTAAISQTVGSQVNEIHPAPTWDDHTFTGWHFDTATTEEVNFAFAKAYSDVTLYAGWEEIKPGDVQYTVKQHFINQAGVEDLTLNYIGVFSAPAGSKIASLIDSFEKDTQTHVYKQAETKHNGQLLDREEATLAEGDVIDLYYYMDIWNEEKNTINEGDDIPDMYQAVVKFQAGDLYGTVTGTATTQVFTLIDEAGAYVTSGIVTPDLTQGKVETTPNEGYAFDIWTMNDGETGVNPEASITVQGGSTTNFYAHFALDKIGGVNGGDGTPDKYQALVTYKVVNGTWSDGSSADIVKVFTLQKKNDNGVWADVAAVLGAMPTGMKPAAGYMTIGAWNKTHAADERPVHASVYTWTFTTRNAPDVTIAKYANKTSATVGETITYTIIVTNTGNVTLTELVVKDVFTQGGNGETVWTIASLAPGASQKIEFSYRTSNHDVGGLKNIAVVTGKGPDGGEVTDTTQSVETDVYREHIVRPTRPALNKEDHYAYIVGYPDGLVHPERNITRAEVSTIFFRMLLDESREDFWAQENWFSDVPADQWYNNAVSTLSNAGLITGYPDGSFKPNANITRAEFATIAIRFFLEEDVEITENNLTDVKGHWAEANINLAYALNLITGYPDNTFRPDQKITRAEAMTIVNRVLERAPHKDHLLDDMIEWPDNMDTDAWYYADVQEATNSHEFYKTEIKGEDEEYEIWTELLPVRDWAALERMWSEANSSKNPGEVVDINISTPEASN